MSYSQSYHRSITVSDSKTVSYPKSESGGTMTVHFSQSVPINITIDVETTPFDHSVSGANGSIDILTGSVVAMNAAQVAAIQKTTKEVSKAVIDGFFGTIKTELSQQLQALDSGIKAGYGLILEQGKAVSAQKGTMETDYGRISSRYVVLFKDLDDECYKRIYALDKSAFSLAQDVQKKLLSEATVNITAKNLLGIQDESSSKSMLLISRLNRMTREVLETLKNYVNQEVNISSLINLFMNDEALSGRVTEFVPVLWTDQDNLGSPAGESGAVDQNCYLPDYMQESQKAVMAEKVSARFASSADSKWEILPEDEKSVLDREFKVIAESVFGNSSDEKDTRVYNKLMELWQSNAVSSLKE